MGLKVLHLSDGSLPDWRIEKAALSSKNVGHEVYFAGLKPFENYNREVFLKTFTLDWNPKSRYGLPLEWHSLKKQMKNILGEVNPDIIHAHNVFSAKMAKEIGGYSMIYDNHEYWSKFVTFQYQSSETNYEDKNGFEKMKRYATLVSNTLKTRKRRTWIEWELEIVSEVPTIVPSESIRVELMDISHNIFVVPNFPLKSEFESRNKPHHHETISSVYAGTPVYKGYETPIKNIDGFIGLFNDINAIGVLNIIGWESKDSQFVKYHGYLDRARMFDQMTKSSFGFIPWKKHPFHPYCSPNKAYEYAHAGLIIFCTNSIKPIFDELKENVIGFNDYEEMVIKVKETKKFPNEIYDRQLKTYNFARENLYWEKHEKNIFQAYNKA